MAEERVAVAVGVREMVPVGEAVWSALQVCVGEVLQDKEGSRETVGELEAVVEGAREGVAEVETEGDCVRLWLAVQVPVAV